MTVSYSLELSSIGLSTSFRILLKWRGSIFKVIYKEGIIYFICYAIISLIYRLALNDEAQLVFESAAALCRKYIAMIPVTFILGFYVSIVFTRWQGIINSLPWVDQSAIYISTYLSGSDAKCKLYRRSIARYLVAAQVLALRAISMQVKKRFPTLDHIVACHLLTEEEMKSLQAIEAPSGDTKHWAPTVWVINILNRARQENRIPSDFLLNACVDVVYAFRGCNGGLLLYDWINVPLVYTQLVSVAVWSYFGAALIGEQWLDYSKTTIDEPPIDLYIPFFTVVQFVCLVGWLRVAQNMLNPLGEWDDDVELNWFIDRALHMGFLYMDDMHGVYPELKMDSFVDDDVAELPHTEASLPFSGGMVNSCADVEISAADAVVVSAGDISRRSSSRFSSRRSSMRSKMSIFVNRFRRTSSSRSSVEPKTDANGERISHQKRSVHSAGAQSPSASRTAAEMSGGPGLSAAHDLARRKSSHGARKLSAGTWHERRHSNSDDRHFPLETLSESEEGGRKDSQLSRMSDVREVDEEEAACGTTSDPAIHV